MRNEAELATFYVITFTQASKGEIRAASPALEVRSRPRTGRARAPGAGRTETGTQRQLR
jgi:hypothetical protein